MTGRDDKSFGRRKGQRSKGAEGIHQRYSKHPFNRAEGFVQNETTGCQRRQVLIVKNFTSGAVEG